MVGAYCLLTVEPGKAARVLALTRRKKGVKEVAMTYGTYDLVVRIDAETPEDLTNFIFDELRQIPGVVTTETLIAARIEPGIG